MSSYLVVLQKHCDGCRAEGHSLLLWVWVWHVEENNIQWKSIAHAPKSVNEIDRALVRSAPSISTRTVHKPCVVYSRKYGICYWRASEVSETLSGEHNRDFAIFIYLLSERSVRDTYRV